MALEEVNKIFEYFKKLKYPWFSHYFRDLSMEEKLKRIHRLYRNARAAFSSFDEKLLAELSPKEIEERIETLRINSPNGLEYY